MTGTEAVGDSDEAGSFWGAECGLQKIRALFLSQDKIVSTN